MPLEDPFPFWLYGGNLDYLANVLSSKSLDRAVWRILIALGMRQPVDPVGFTDYLVGRRPAFVPPPPAPPDDTGEVRSLQPLPWIDGLRAFLATVPQNVRVLLVMPPVYFTALPHPGGKQAVEINACKEALKQVAGDRRHGSFLDFRLDLPGTHDTTDFLDVMHYRSGLAHQIEDRIIAQLGSDATGTDQAGHASPGTTVLSRLNGRSP